MPTINPKEVEISAVRSQGAGGQNVNKVATAIHLRFDIEASSLPEGVKGRLSALNDSRITEGGVVIIKAQSHRTQEQNREAALERLQSLVNQVATPPKPRRATKPSRRAKERRLESKSKRSAVKSQRKGVSGEF
jgi:ribosome-associated protein